MTVAKTPYVKTPSQSNLSDCEAVAMAAEECAITSTEYSCEVEKGFEFKIPIIFFNLNCQKLVRPSCTEIVIVFPLTD